jgi:DNA-binding transcriptional MocR family regulator
MFLEIDKGLTQPVYLQIRDRIVELIRAGTLEAGAKLPGTRELAQQLGVSRKTVLQAYLELAADNWVESRPGSCTYVLDRSAQPRYFTRHNTPLEVIEAPALPQTEMDWSAYQFDWPFFSMPPYSAKWKGAEEWINFSRAIPDVRLFPFERIKKVSSQMLWDPQTYFFDYANPQGYMPLLEYLEQRLAKEGMSSGDGRNGFCICSGFQTALNLLMELLVKPGETVVVEDPTFNSILNLLTARDIPHLGVPMEADGMDVDYLERLLPRARPKAIITIPTLHNPTGITMSREKRERLVELAQKHNVAIIEDNWSLLLGHEGQRQPPLKALDGGGHVVQIGSFSKAFLPGTRVAWVVLPRGLAPSFGRVKRALDRSDSPFLQTLVHEFIKKGFMDLHCRKVERIYRARRELMDELMRQHFPGEVSWKRPQGGFSFWVQLPRGMQSMDVLRAAVAEGVEFAPGNYFYVGRPESNCLRLAFSTLTQPQLRQGVKRLGAVLREAMGQTRSREAVRNARQA